MSDPLVDNYLTRLEAAASVLPVDRRAELVEEISAHITEAQAAGQVSDEAALRDVLDRLGDPDDIVAAAREAGGDDAPGPAEIASRDLAPKHDPGQASSWGALEIAAVATLALGGFFVPLISPVVGLTCAWAAPKWTRKEKWWVTAIVGGLVILPVVAQALINTFSDGYGPRLDLLSWGWSAAYWGGGAVAGIYLAMRLGTRD